MFNIFNLNYIKHIIHFQYKIKVIFRHLVFTFGDFLELTVTVQSLKLFFYIIFTSAYYAQNHFTIVIIR